MNINVSMILIYLFRDFENDPKKMGPEGPILKVRV